MRELVIVFVKKPPELEVKDQGVPIFSVDIETIFNVDIHYHT